MQGAVGTDLIALFSSGLDAGSSKASRIQGQAGHNEVFDATREPPTVFEFSLEDIEDGPSIIRPVWDDLSEQDWDRVDLFN